MKCKLSRAEYIMALGGLAVGALAMAFDVTVGSVHAESSSANASVTVANTISLTLTGGDLVINNLTPGNASDSNVITASVTSNSPYGFHLSATTGASGGTTSLVNTADSNFTFTNLDTNKATLANFSDNTWGYSYSEDGSSWISGDYGSATAGYNGLPLDGNDDGDSGVVLFNSDSYLGSKSMQFKIGAKSATTQAAGTYTNTVNFYAVTNPEPIPSQSSCLTAPLISDVVPGITYMQDINSNNRSSVLGSLATNVEYQIKDNRDNESYCISKLADDNLWMLDNLALNLLDSTVLNLLSSTNTNIDQNVETNILTSLREGNRSAGSQYANESIGNLTEGNSYSAARVNLDYKSVIPTDSISSAGGYRVGGYYNYCAVSAGSYCYGDGTDYGTSSGNATNDICPSGWRMPTGGSSGEFKALARAVTGSSSTFISGDDYIEFRTVFHWPMSGQFSGGLLNSQNERSVLWSSSLDNGGLMYAMDVGRSIVPTGSDYRYYGFSLRCILE